MRDLFGSIAADQQLPEILVPEHAPEASQALLQNLLAMGYEQQSVGLAGPLLAKPFIVKSRNHRFSGTGGGNNQVFVMAAHLPLRRQLVENLLLIGIRLDIKQIRPGLSFPRPALRPQRPGQPNLLLGVIGFKFAGVPVDLKGFGNLADGVGQVFGRHFDIPFQPAGDGGVGKVGRADIGCRKTGFPIENISFRMQARPPGIIGNLNFGVGQRLQLGNGFHIRRTHIGSRDDPQLPALLRKPA